MLSECVTEGLRRGQTYRRSDIISLLAKEKKGLSPNSYVWLVCDLVKRGVLTHEGTDRYALPASKQRRVYEPCYSERAKSLRDSLKLKYPLIPFTVFEMVLMNEFLNHLIARNTIYVQAERDMSAYIFTYFKYELCCSALYKPSEKEFRHYWRPDTVVVLDLISQAPLSKGNPHDITIEKLLVDIYCDRQIQSSYSKAEYPTIVKTAYERYRVNTPRLLRYAKRRNKAQEIAKFISEREVTVDAVKG